MQQSRFYEIRIEGELSSRWSDWFAGLSITAGPHQQTILSGELPDQAALHGLLMKLRDLHLVLISVNPIAASQNPPGSADADGESTTPNPVPGVWPF